MTTKVECSCPECGAEFSAKPDGGHRLLCGDSTVATDVERVLGGVEPHLMVTDPPYGIGYDYDSHDDSSNSANVRMAHAVFDLAPKAKVWTPGLMNLARDIDRYGVARVLCWHKGFAQAGNGLGGASTWEPVLVIDVPQKKLPNDYLHFNTDRIQLAGKSLRKHHPCPKPSALFAHLLEAFSSPKSVIYEPFSGSGTTIVAAEMMARTCRAIEISPAYVDVAVKRWQDFTGKQAVLDSDGRTFDEIEAARKPAVERK